MDVLKGFCVVILVLFVLGVVSFGVSAIGFGNYWFWAPKNEQVRREVFENTKSYRDGLRRDFDNLYLSYEQEKDPDAKAAIKSVIRHRADGVDPELVPDSIRNLLRSN